MSEHPLRQILPSIERELGIHPLSLAFIRDPQYLKKRSSRNVGPTLLRRLLHIGLTREERDLIFPGEFDLGNMLEVPDDKCTNEALWNLEFDGKEVSEAARLLRDVSAITGHEPHAHRAMGASHAFKVAVLVYRLKHRPALTQLLAILRPPTPETASLELTNPYWSGAPSDLRYHLEDLHSYLSAEIASERLAAIDATFGKVRDRMGDALLKIETAFKMNGSPSSVEIVRRYNRATEQWRPRQAPPTRRVLRADEQLYVHLHVLDFLHFAEVDRRLTTEPLLRRTIMPVTHCLPTGRVMVSALRERPILPIVVQLHAPMCEALSEDISLRQFRDNLVDSERLLRRRLELLSIPPATDVDMGTCLAVMIVARELKVQAPAFEPRLHGASHGLSTSVKAAVKQPLASIHEEFGRVLRYAVDWVRYALIGWTEVYDAKRVFEMQLVATAENVLNTHDAERVETYLSNLDEYARIGFRGVM